jgi:SAM-dependent methyltransferase
LLPSPCPTNLNWQWRNLIPFESTVQKVYVHYGCGSSAVPGWINFDASPTLFIQKVPVLGRVLKPRLNCVFDPQVRFGDIVRGLPIESNSADGVFCSHVLEHLPLKDFHRALDETFRMLRPKTGRFRCIVPDLESFVREYKEALAGPLEARGSAAESFCRETMLGIEERRRGLRGRLEQWLGNRAHCWMWDRYGLEKALRDHGFENVEPFEKGACDDEMFLRPERDHQFHKGFGLQCTKP